MRRVLHSVSYENQFRQIKVIIEITESVFYISYIISEPQKNAPTRARGQTFCLIFRDLVYLLTQIPCRKTHWDWAVLLKSFPNPPRSFRKSLWMSVSTQMEYDIPPSLDVLSCGRGGWWQTLRALQATKSSGKDRFTEKYLIECSHKGVSTSLCPPRNGNVLCEDVVVDFILAKVSIVETNLTFSSPGWMCDSTYVFLTSDRLM